MSNKEKDYSEEQYNDTFNGGGGDKGNKFDLLTHIKKFLDWTEEYAKKAAGDNQNNLDPGRHTLAALYKWAIRIFVGMLVYIVISKVLMALFSMMG